MLSHALAARDKSQGACFDAPRPPRVVGAPNGRKEASALDEEALDVGAVDVGHPKIERPSLRVTWGATRDSLASAPPRTMVTVRSRNAGASSGGMGPSRVQARVLAQPIRGGEDDAQPLRVLASKGRFARAVFVCKSAPKERLARGLLSTDIRG